MCTVLFLPAESKVTLVSCRDEDPGRPSAAVPSTFEENNTQLMYPKDGAAGGTWMGVNEYGYIIILLNGAFENHVKEPFYRKSRGLLVKELLATPYPTAYWYSMQLHQIEPFTLIIWANGSLHQLVWDGSNQHHFELDPQQPHIWSSATLYNEAAQQQRKDWFQQGLLNHSLNDSTQILSFLTSHNDEENGFVMKRNAQLSTLSISIVEQINGVTTFAYHDMKTNNVSIQSLPTSN